jgi:hypothetical protein
MKPYLRYAFVILVSALLMSCGGDNLGNDNVTVPEGGNIEWLVGDYDLSYPDTEGVLLFNNPLQLIAEDAQGRPVRSAVINVDYFVAAPHTYDLSFTTLTGLPPACQWGPAANAIGLVGDLSSTQIIMQFFDQDGDPVDSPLQVITDEYGVAEFSVDLVVGCVGFGTFGGIGHEGTIRAQSGTTVSTLDLSVQ